MNGARSSYVDARRRYWDEFAGRFSRWEPRRRTYQRRLREIYSHLIPAGSRVLELGCGGGDLLAAVRPSLGVGVELSPAMAALARTRHPELRIVNGDAEEISLGETFDAIILSDLVNDVWDVQALFENALRHSHRETRIILNSYSRLWEGPRRAAEAMGLAKEQLPQNWLTREDLFNLMYLSGLEPVRFAQEIAWPVATPVLERLMNRYVVKLWPFRHLGVTNVIVARPAPRETREAKVTVVVPARNEAGNIAQVFSRTPQMGLGTELVFVEGGSSDDTYATIEREIAAHPEWEARLFRQTGKGKGDAVRVGFGAASGELLMILDADLTVAPEDLPRFYEAWASGRADFANGVRLVYPMEQRAMRFFNLLGNKFFSQAYTWLLGQTIKDTLCGTKVLSRPAYDTIAANRAWFGEIDPFGDFDLLFGAARFSMKIVDVPVRYRERTYGETNIKRWSEGLLLLRMVARASRRLKFV